MKLIAPNLSVGQRFGENADGAYAADGLLGHPGIDYGGTINYGQPVLCAVGGSTVSALLSKGSSNLESYRAVNTIYEDETGCYEIQYGHVIDMYVNVGDKLVLGQHIASIGNTGDVYGGTPFGLITDAQKRAGSHQGAHIHLQVRVVVKEALSTPVDSTKHYVNNGSGTLELDGFRYSVPEWDNGYNGCVDPSMFYEGGLEDVVKAETEVASRQTDPTVVAAFGAELIKGAQKLLGIKSNQP